MAINKLLLLGLATTALTHVIIPRQAPNPSCRVLPGDAAWPAPAAWAALNQTVGGRLIASVPLASVCHDAPFNDYNGTACTELQTTWNQTTLQRLNSPAEFFNSYFKNYTCDEYTPRSTPCTLGNMVSYVINVTGPADVQAGIAFAKANNIRLVIKNTGHDYLGKSTGKGGLSLWTHNLKSTQYIANYSTNYYQGPAIKLGAGIEGWEAYAAADTTNHRIVGGSCPTVGIAGGYSQGGGHSMLASAYGMAADNVLEWEVVTMDGQHLVATPNQNADLYWAMCGGGGGNYAVAIAMTSRLHQDSIIGGASVIFNDTKVGNDAFWEAVGAFHVLLAPFVDAGNSYTYTLTNNVFLSWGVTMPGADMAQIDALMKPFLDDLTKRGIDYEFTAHVSNNYYEHVEYYLGPLPQGFADYAPFTGSRILPRSMFMDPDQNKIVTDVLRNASLAQGYAPMACQALNVSYQAHSDNAVLPAWRNALSVCLTPGDWDPTATPAEMAARQDYAANVLQPMMDKATPGGGVYLNEANYKQQNWQQEFYGTNYPKLLTVKQKYDPESVLYVNTGVGSDAWTVDGNGRLCRA